MNQANSKTVDRERYEAVERVRQGWINRLIDLSRRNNLLYYRDLKTGTLDFPNTEGKALTALLEGESVSIAHLLPNLEEGVAAACLQKIYRRAIANLEEKGLETLFLALGMASWTPDDGGRPPEAAVLLVPMAVELKGTVKLRRSGEAQLNPVLLHVLEVQYGCSVTPQDLLNGAESVAEDELPDLKSIYAQLKQLAAEVPGFNIKPRAVLSNFSFQKMAMVRDLNDYLDQMAAHDVIASIAGDVKARQSARGSAEEIDVSELDRIPPDKEFFVFDADSSQQTVIQAVLSKRNGVIQGPPGTGKSQTIANLIAALAAAGQRVLFVAEKRAALEVVMQRLNQKGLGHLLLDFHSADISRRAVMQQFADSLDIVRTVRPVDAADTHRRFVERRSRLNKYVEQLHAKRSPSNLSVYEIQGKLLKLNLSEFQQVSTRFRGDELNHLSREKAEEVEQYLREISGNALADLFLGNCSSPWKEADLAPESVDTVLRTRQNIAERYQKLRTALGALNSLSDPKNLEQAKELLALVREVNVTLSNYSADLFQEDLDKRVKELGPAENPFSEAAAWIFDGNFKKAVARLKTLRIAGKVEPAQMLKEVTKAAQQLKHWRSLASYPNSVPTKVSNLGTIQEHLDAILADLPKMESCLKHRKLSQLPLDEFARLFSDLASDRNSALNLARLRGIERDIEKLGAGSILVELKRSKPDPSLWVKQFQYAWLTSQLEQAQMQDRELATFDRKNHEDLLDEFRQLDQERLKIASGRVCRAHAERAIAAMNSHPEQEGVVRREALKKARHLPLRKLLAEAPDVLTTLRPCWMASPLSVSQLLDANRRYFDVVIFDEASQVLPEDAVPAILRAERVVVAGDRYQLPPTTFFSAANDGEDENDESPAEGFESLLDLMSSFLNPWPLLWHYRSQDESLIAFSNRHIYNNRLITFPGPGLEAPISHVLIPSTPGKDGQEDSADREVQHVVELVLKHATERPHQTLGVITMGIKHANRIEAALDAALRRRPELGSFFDESRSDRFFVKNIERVQGDERDAIILSVGYGKDRSGHLPYRFGPLLTEGGERRLNVAITRARQRMVLVSSFDHLDMDPSRSKARGAELLRLYIQYAASKGKLLGDSTSSTDEPLNPFEADVFDSLRAKGIPLLPQWGVSQYRIDMVAQHPSKPGRFVLAIECDGASYHSAKTARDRDRLRQQQLEALGWRFHRIWSTDWFTSREAEIERAVAAYQSAVERADQVDTAKEQPPEPVTTPPSSTKATEPEPSVAAKPQRQPRPNVSKRSKIDDYSLGELIALVRWILSDGCLRTDEEILREMVPELGFKRRGTKIDAAVQRAIKRVRS